MSIIYPQSQSDSHEHLKERAFANMAEAARKVEHQAAEIQKLNEALAKQKRKGFKGQAAYSRLWFRANAALKLLQGLQSFATEPTAEAELEAALKEHAAANDARHDRALIERQAEAIRQLTDERDKRQLAIDAALAAIRDISPTTTNLDIVLRSLQALHPFETELQPGPNEVIVYAGSPPREVQRLPIYLEHGGSDDPAVVSLTVKRAVERQPDAEPRPGMVMTFEDGDVYPPFQPSKEGPNA